MLAKSLTYIPFIFKVYFKPKRLSYIVFIFKSVVPASMFANSLSYIVFISKSVVQAYVNC